VIFASYTSDIIRYMKTFKNLNYRPPVIIGDNAGFSDPAFIANVTLPIARRRTRSRCPSWPAKWAIPSRRAD
jgi:hypothetical protein